MVENNNLQQVNSFIAGMNLDASDQYLPDSNYREAYNLRLVADTNSNTGTLHNIEGVKLYQRITTDLPTLAEGESYTNIRVIHTDTIRKYGVAIVKATVKSSESETEYYYIFRFINKDELSEGESGTPKLIFGPCSTQIGDNISSVTRYEDDDNIKFYFADGIKPIRSLNISPSIDSTRPMTDDGSFSIYPTALLSQPEFVTLGSGNLKAGAYQYGYQLFTKNGAETEISPLTNLIYTTESSVSPTTSNTVKGSAKGDNTGKSIQIRIKINDDKYDRIKIISVFYEETTSVPVIQVLGDMNLTHNEDGTIDDVYYQDINNSGISTLTTEEFNSITSVHFVPKLLETKNNHLFASDIQYQDNSFDTEYDARAYSYALTENDSMIAVLQNNNGVDEIVATRDDILNKSTVIPKDHDCINPYSMIEKNCNSFYDTYTSDINTSNIRCAYTKYNQQILWGGEGLNVSWRFIVTDLDEITNGGIYTGSEYYGCDGTANGAEARDFEGVWVSNVSNTGQLLNTRFLRLSDTKKKLPCNYSNPIIASKLKSLQRDEVYRYGIVLYNKYNQASPVKWIADIRTPSADKLGFETFMANRVVSFTEDKSDYSRSALAVRPLGIEFIVKNLPEDVTSYEIVRCKRSDSDRSTISQGIIGTTSWPSVSPSSNSLFPSYVNMLTLASIQNENNDKFTGGDTINGDDTNYYRINTAEAINFTSPEVCYNNENIKNSLPNSGLKLEMVKFLFSNDSDIAISDRGDYIYSGNATSRLKNVTKNSVVIGNKTGVLPYLYTNSNMFFRTFNMFEQSNKCTVTNGVVDLAAYSGSATTGQTATVTNIVYPTETSWENYRNKLDFIDGAGAYTYTDWVITGFNESNGAYTVNNKLMQGPHGRSIVLQGGIPVDYSNKGSFPILPMIVTGSRIISQANSVAGNTEEVTLSNNAYYNESVLGTQLCNLRKTVVPYGGYNYTAKQFNTYISISAFSVKPTGSGVEGNSLVFGGDTYITLFKYVNVHYFAGLKEDGSVETSLQPFIIYAVPTESVINLAYQNGADLNQYVQIEPANVNGKYVQDKPLYVYNSVYSVEPSARLFTPENIYDEWNKHIDVRTCFSLNKNNDETVDQWTKFQPLNYLDVDTRYGSINNIRTFGNELIFWQSNAVGKFSVNERTLITDDSNQPLMLGTGGVLSRYDYLATVNGMKDGHNDSDCQSDNILYWFDYDRKELCAYSNNQVVSLSKAKYVQSYLNKLSLDKDKQVSKPICTYDKDYNEVIATLSKDESLVYNEKLQVFTGFYSIVPDNSLYFNSDVYFVKDQDLYKYNDNVTNNNFGDTPLPIKLKYIVNKDYLRTKVFDNLEFTGYLDKDNLTFNFEADGIQSKELKGTDLSDRENNYRGAIPRVNTEELFANRMRGRVLYCTIDYALGNSENTFIVTNENSDYMQTIQESSYIVTNNKERSGLYSDTRFELPYIRTTYRISKS